MAEAKAAGLGAFKVTKPSTKSGGHRYSFVAAGPPGSGKSTLLGSMAEVGKTLLIATLAREASSWKYRQHDVDTIILQDLNWRPSQKVFESEAFSKFLELMQVLLNDDIYDCICVDSGTELAEAGWHEAMRPYSVASPAEIEGKSRWLPYDTLDTLLDQAIKQLVSLGYTDEFQVAKKPKHVGIAWHVQPPKEDSTEDAGGTKVRKASADHAGEGVEYEGKVLPMIRGRFRRRLVGQVDAYVHTDIRMNVERVGATMKKSTEYVIQVRPDVERHTKLPGPLPDVDYVPNNFKELLRLIEATAPVKR